jgi:hypothetical protein
VCDKLFAPVMVARKGCLSGSASTVLHSWRRGCSMASRSACFIITSTRWRIPASVREARGMMVCSPHTNMTHHYILPILPLTLSLITRGSVISDHSECSPSLITRMIMPRCICLQISERGFNPFATWRNPRVVCRQAVQPTHLCHVGIRLAEVALHMPQVAILAVAAGRR